MKIIKTIWLKLQNSDREAFPRWHLLVASCLVAGLVTLINAPAPNENTAETQASSNEERPSVITPLEVPVLSDPEELLNPLATLIPKSNPLSFYEFDTAPLQTEAAQDPLIKHEVVGKGDNLSSIFQRAGLDNKKLAEVLESCKESKTLKQMHPGHRLTFTVDPQGTLNRLDYQPNLLETRTFTRQGEKFTYSESKRKPDIQTKVASAVIQSSLYGAAKTAQISDKLIYDMANVFAFDIDFALDLQPGDSFKILYEEAYLDGKKVGGEQLLAAEFTNEGKVYKAVRYLDKDGQGQFYSDDGKALRKGFLRTPVEFARISSGFSLGRLHPILNKIRAHKGVDYSAPTGTPIMAAGDGKVTLAGTYSGYGNCVTIDHAGNYSTLYGHMSRFASGIRKGSTVKQGQIIGYVGSTGLATGPHLHYEFHVGGKVVNPITVTLPKAEGIPKNEMARFSAQIQPLFAQLKDAAGKPRVVAVQRGTPANQNAL